MTKKGEQTQKKPELPLVSEAGTGKENISPSKVASTAEQAIKDEAANENPLKHWIAAIQDGDEKEIQAGIAYEIKNILKRHKLESYLTLMLFDPIFRIVDSDLNKIYEAASSSEADKKDILLILYSGGGSIEPAYLISKTLKALSGKRFVVAVPRMAKSAATLICLGADEIHMGLTSQLGPIDPQIGGLPALGLANALDTLANLACKFPGAAEMLSGYLKSQLDLRILGYFNRVTESAVQYGERLLANKQLAKDKTAHDVADQLVNHYKDHGFVIDVDEARKLLGSDIIRTKSAEYSAANEIFNFLDFVRFLLSDKQKKKFYYTGAIDNGMSMVPEKSE